MHYDPVPGTLLHRRTESPTCAARESFTDGAARIPGEQISLDKATYTFRSPSTPSAFVADFRNYYGPTMNAFAAAEQNGKAADLQKELEDLFERQNTSGSKDATVIPATFRRVTVACCVSALLPGLIAQALRAAIRRRIR